MEAVLATGAVWGAGLADALMARGIDLSTLGVGYLIFLANVVVAALFFLASRAWLVISPNRSTSDYGLYVSVVLVILFVATVLENEVLPAQDTTLPYAAVPHVLVLFVMHLWIYYRHDPWLVGLGISAMAGAVPVVAISGIMTDAIVMAHWLALGLVCVLLGFVWLKAVTTKHAFVKARSIYIATKETADQAPPPQKPWLGLPQWVALVCASLVLALVNELLRGSALIQVPAIHILTEAVMVLVITVLVSSIPAATYWLARKTWMPELTRLVWMVWLVVGFAFTYGNFLTSLERA